MRLHLAYLALPPPVVVGRKALHQANLEVLVEMADQGLLNEGFQPPDANELWRLMRLFARSSRRGYRGIHTVRHMLNNRKDFTAKRYLARFVLDRLDLKSLK